MSTNKLSNAIGLSRHNLTTTSRASARSRIGLKLTLTAVPICGLAVSSSAQSPATAEIAAEKGFTIPLNVQTPMVLLTQPDAACDLHPEGVNDAAQTMRLYANADGYVRVHIGTKHQADARLQLDCTSADKVTTYPLHLRAGSAPTDDMPAPQATAPTPKGSRILPALTDAAATKLSDQDLSSQGYPRRPDAVASPANYKAWLNLVSRPLTLLQPHSVSCPDVSHRLRNVEAGTKAQSGANWSGYEAKGAKGSYEGVEGEWNVPGIAFGENGYTTWSAFWVELDGDGTSDLIQAGTEQNYTEMASLDAKTFLYGNVISRQVLRIGGNHELPPAQAE
jgi:hypothetical protein